MSRGGLAGAGAVALAVVIAFAWPKKKLDEPPAPDASPAVVVRDAAVPLPSPPQPPARVTEGCVRLAGGTFTMGSSAGEGLGYERPRHQVTLRGFCIDRTEVTVAAYRACVLASGGCEAPTAYSATPGQPQVFCNWGRRDRDDHPINCVTPAQAERFCAWRHTNGHLPTEDQWEFAARGTAGRRYPWGDAPEPSPQNTNLCGSECRDFVASVGQAGWTAITNWTDPWPTTSSVGALPQAGNTPDGLIGMAGNVWEWARTPYGDYTSRAGTATTYTSVDRNNRVLRGGGWYDSVPGVARAAFRHGYGTTLRSEGVGFRCVAEE